MEFKAQRFSEAPEAKVLDFIRQFNLVPGSGRLLVAVSGGPDSVCLLHILSILRNELKVDLHIAHLNHRLRSEESDGDARYVSGLAERLGIPCTVGEIDIEKFRSSHGGSMEEAAREARYGFLADTARSVGAEATAVGHTRDDNIETILLHLVRGTGTRGVTGLKHKTVWRSGGQSVTIIRPLLGLTREETARYCRENRLEPRLDSSNLSLSPLRNRIRRQLIPLLESYNPRVGDALLRTARTAVDEMEFLESAAAGAWGSVAQRYENTVTFDKAGLKKLPPAIQRHLLRQAVEKIYGSLKDIEMRHIDIILDAMQLRSGKRLSLPGGMVFAVEYDKYLLCAEESALSPLPGLEGEHEITVPGETVIPGWRILANVQESGQPVEDGEGFTARFDFEKTGNRLRVRSRREGDRFQPLGMAQTKKAGEFMIDARIPRSWRERIPVVCSPDQIIWLAGWRIDDRVKVTAGTSRVLKLEFIKTG